MAFLAFDQQVFASERKSGHAMVKYSFLPRLFAMAGFAFFAFLTLVLVILLMA